MNQQPDKITKITLLVSLLEGAVVAAILLLIPPDPKNAFLLGYSKSRLVLIAITAGGIVFWGLAMVHMKLQRWITRQLEPGSRFEKVWRYLGGVMMLLLWLLIWLPAYRLEEYSASFTRIQPLLIWLCLVSVQFALAAWLLGGRNGIKKVAVDINNSRKWLIIGTVLFLVAILVFLILALTNYGVTDKQLYFPPGTPLSALQVLIAWLVFFLLLRLEGKFSLSKRKQIVLTILVFALIWVTVFISWSSVPATCTDDRPGPYPPNNACYPSVNDAVYSIGSHYIVLGQGIYNHWLTDKPLYIAFLALAQSVSGAMIDDYLRFQIAVIALIPALLYLFGRKTFGHAFGVFLATLAGLQGYFAITLYRVVGSVNVKLENPEVLTALFLLILSFPVFKWLKEPTVKKWTILSGGILGLSVLLRFTPLFIAPLLLLAILISGKWKLKELIPAFLLFTMAFVLAFAPWFFSARDGAGKNFYLSKIEQVVNNRFSNRQESRDSDVMNQSEATTVPEVTDNQQEPLFTYQPEEIGKAGISGVFFHFMNNIYSGLAKLPTKLLFHPIQEQVTDDIWSFSAARPIWQADWRFENLLAVALNLALVLTGILAAWKRFGLAGLSGVIIQLGYYTGNALAQTSGGRYLEPVFWVLLIYYGLGLYTLTLLVVRFFNGEKQVLPLPSKPSEKAVSESVQCEHQWLAPVLLAGFLGLGMILPALNLLPSRLPAEFDPIVEQRAFEELSQRGLVTEQQWHNFLEDSQSVAIQGSAYHARYYRSNFYRAGNLSFEVMLLASEHVLVAYSPRIIPLKPLPDASDVILIGCLLRKDQIWGARRLILQTIAVINFGDEADVLFDDQTNWTCTTSE
ncbi:MAG TPA: hypothetical protein PLQ69_00150 [Paludibacter sp.]|nr:hypothetical protein [Paludibacter sp.]